MAGLEDLVDRHEAIRAQLSAAALNPAALQSVREGLRTMACELEAMAAVCLQSAGPEREMVEARLNSVRYWARKVGTEPAGERPAETHTVLVRMWKNLAAVLGVIVEIDPDLAMPADPSSEDVPGGHETVTETILSAAPGAKHRSRRSASR